MKLLKIVLAAITGTTFMTLFSYRVSQKKKEQFREPVLLDILIHRWSTKTPIAEKSRLLGWLVHYLVGLFLSSVYERIWTKTNIRPTVFSGLTMGLFSSLFGVGSWKLAFSIHPSPPDIHFRRYYLQLIVAHVVFGAFAVIGYRLPK